MHLDARRAVGVLRAEFEPRGVYFQASGNSKFSMPDRYEVYPSELTALALDAKERYIEINHAWQAICKVELEKAIIQGAICKELAEIVSCGI